MKPILWRHTARIVALAVIVALCPLPVMAGGADQATKPPGIRASAAAIVKATPPAASPAPAARAQSSTDLGSKSFFKTPAGVVTLVLVGAGVGFALYSTKHDRIKSSGR